MTLPNCYPTESCPTRILNADDSSNQQRYVKLTSEPTTHTQRPMTEAQKKRKLYLKQQRSAAIRQPYKGSYLQGDDSW